MKKKTDQDETIDRPIDLSAKRKCTSSRLSNVASLLEQTENFANNPQLLKNISIDALNALNQVANNQTNASAADAAQVAAAFLLPKSLSSLTTQQQIQQLMLKHQQRIFSCANCQIDFHKQENYAIHKKYYCSATKQLLLDSNCIMHHKQSPSPTDDLDTATNHFLNSGPNSPQSQHTITPNRTSAASINLDQLVTKKTSTSSSVALNNTNNSKTSGCVSPSISNSSPVGLTTCILKFYKSID